MEKFPFLQSANTIPRAPKITTQSECCCSNSCEKVIELLLATPDPITYEEKELTFTKIKPTTFHISPELRTWLGELRAYSFSLLTNRQLPLTKRILILGTFLQEIANLKVANSKINLSPIFEQLDLSRIEAQPNYELIITLGQKWLGMFAEQSKTIKKLAPRLNEIINHFSDPSAIKATKEHLYKHFPDFDHWFEKIMINHLLFKDFPINYRFATYFEYYLGIVGVYFFTQFLVYCYMIDKTDMIDLVDIISSIFRLIEHSNFEFNAYLFLKRDGLNSIALLSTILL